jgi:geranyl-CoA carboxylase alpha subunit
MGDKRKAKERMLAAGVPCIPGHLGDAQDEAAFADAVRQIGLPVIIKAAAGGGGRGMRQVRALADLRPNLQAARSEARNAFGDGTVYLEKLVEGGRHIEIQVVADEHGNVIHLGERDCSVQRRFQKVVEEAPSPFVDPQMRERMGEAAIAAARAVDYVGVGTVEFLVDAAGEFYFIEMNTRLQVEHPVTEMVAGVDLVALQLRIAAGERLPLRQEDVRISGHAIEVRLYAEDPENDYLPQTGRVLHWRPLPAEGVRIDSGVTEGMELTPYYDAMVAKIIAHAPSRAEARRRIAGALRRTPLLGLATNRSLLLDICNHPTFAAGEATTDFLRDTGIARSGKPHDIVLAAAALLHGLPEGGTVDDWVRSGRVKWSLDADGTSVTISRDRHGDATATIGAHSYAIRPLAIAERDMRCLIDGIAYNFTYVRTPRLIEVDFEGERLSAERHKRHVRAEDEAGAEGVLKAPINGRIIKVDVEQGQKVARGQAILTIEAMKMEMVLGAPADGIVAQLNVKEGNQVTARQPMLVIAAEPQETP